MSSGNLLRVLTLIVNLKNLKQSATNKMSNPKIKSDQNLTLRKIDKDLITIYKLKKEKKNTHELLFMKEFEKQK